MVMARFKIGLPSIATLKKNHAMHDFDQSMIQLRSCYFHNKLVVYNIRDSISVLLHKMVVCLRQVKQPNKMCLQQSSSCKYNLLYWSRVPHQWIWWMCLYLYIYLFQVCFRLHEREHTIIMRMYGTKLFSSAWQYIIGRPNLIDIVYSLLKTIVIQIKRNHFSSPEGVKCS